MCYVQDTMNVQSDLVLAASAPEEVANVDVQSVSASDMSQNCSMSEPAPAEHCEACESVQIQPAVIPDVEEEGSPGTEEISLPNTTTTERSEVEDANSADVNVQPSVAVSPSLIESEQLALLRDSVTSLRSSNDELRHIVSDGLLKVTELETAYAKSVARNKELEEELAQLRGSNERMVSDIALLSKSVAQISARVDKQAEVKESQPDVNDNAASSEGTDTPSSQPTIDQRVGELELKLGQSMTRFGEFASALDSIERDLQRYIRRHSLVVENLCPKEDRSASDAFLVFVNSVLGVKVDESDIDGIHLVDRTNEQSAAATNSPDKKDCRPRPILITFTCYRTRTQVYKVRSVTL